MTALLAALAGLLVLAGARHGADAGEGVETAAAGAEMAELDRLKARGLMDDGAWTAARAEAGRRILSGERVSAPIKAGARDRVWVLAGTGLAVAGALGLYLVIGTSGLSDQPYGRRVDEWAAGPPILLGPVQVAAVEARAVKRNPNDKAALSRLAEARFQANDPIGAASALRRILALDPTDAQAWAHLGEALATANGGVVGVDAEAAFLEALKLDPAQLGARYFLGEAALARGDAATVRAMWLPLIFVLDPSDPRRADLLNRLPGAPK